jgi:K+/H+ antiporter YhaU regulatory subunit KhtT
MGSSDELMQAEELLHQQPEAEPSEALANFTVEEVEVCAGAAMVGRTLSELRFRQRFGVTVVGIRRGENRILAPSPTEPLQEGDRLIVVGTVEAVQAMSCEL